MTDENPESGSNSADSPARGPYVEAIEEYLDAADWLTALDGPLKVHAKTLAKSLDRQLAAKGEIQSALASSFDKCLMRLDRLRPPPQGPVPSLTDSGTHNEESIFSLDLD